MFEDGGPAGASPGVVARLRDAVDELLSLDLGVLSEAALLEVVRGLEVQRRRLPAADHRLIHELDTRGVAGAVACLSTAVLLAQLLRLTPAEATARVSAAADLGPRRGLTGEALDPIFPATAAAQRSGVISTGHAAVIRRTVDALPVSVQAQHDRAVEAALLEHAQTLDPTQLAAVGRRIIDTLDPDGTLCDLHDQQRRRSVTLTANRDGSGDLHGRLDPHCLVTWQAILDSLARPAASDDRTHDPRTAAQRSHDALLDAGQRLLRSDTLPDAGGVPVTLVLTMTAEQALTGRGHATTGHGGLIPAADALRIADQAQIVPVVLTTTGGIVSYGRDRRCASPSQRLALTARDGGCSFPHCDAPASWCHTHHVIPWSDGGRTDLNNLTLVCGYHHREFQRRGWTCTMTDGRPHWTPPAWLDPIQTPQVNTLRQPVPI